MTSEQSGPYYFDPEDAKLVSLGYAAHLSIAKEFPQTPADDLIAHLNYEELTGYDDYDGYYDYQEFTTPNIALTTSQRHHPYWTLAKKHLIHKVLP